MPVPLIKSVYVKAKYLALYKEVAKQVPTGEVATSLFNSGEAITKTVHEMEFDKNSDCEIDGEQLTLDVANAVERVISEGFEIISINPVTSGRWAHNHGNSGTGGFGYGYGYSVTDGMSIIAKKLHI